MFMKTLTAGLLAVSLTFTSLTPTTAQAGMSDDDIAGLLTLLIIGAAIHHSRNSDDAEPTPPPRETRAWRQLPEHCFRRMTRQNGNQIRYFGQRCMERNYDHMNRLPQACHVRFRNMDGQRRQGYRARCLRENGFRTNR